MKRVVVCADDFGATAEVNDAVIALAARGALSAAGCLVDAPAWRDGALRLAGAATRIDLGLHLDLLSPSATSRIGFRTHAGLVAAAGARRLPRSALDAEIAAQFDAFESALGRPPDFVDGHRHVHQLPQIRDRLLDALAHRYGPHHVAVRATVPSTPDGIKARVIAALGGRALAHLLDARGTPRNRDFRGVYDFSPGADYRRLMQGWLARIADGGLVMCHPGRAAAGSGDPIAAARANELRYLGSPEFGADRAAAGVALARFRDLDAAP